MLAAFIDAARALRHGEQRLLFVLHISLYGFDQGWESRLGAA